MCGIAGIVDIKGQAVKREDLETLLSVLHERGPDKQQQWIKENTGLAHARLRILDLSPLADQPMHRNQSSLVFNGEIYNFKSLKQELIEAGQNFTSASDTEVILAGYQTWGFQDLLKKLDGMFAFALFDHVQNKLLLARDRFGQKPLYWMANDTSFQFCSDIRGIWKLNREQLNLDYDSLDHYLTELAVPQPKTIWKEIQQLPPATALTIDCSSGKRQLHSYWKLDVEQKEDISFNEAFEQTEHLLTQAIMKRTLSDVPLGCFLSGGVDSGLVVALLAQHSSQKVKTFTVGFDNHAMSELEDAKKVADRYGTEHHEIKLTPNIYEDLPDLIAYYGEPFADSSALPSYYITKALKKHVTVALSGDGGDEGFGGYEQYGYAHQTDLYFKQYPKKSTREVATLLNKVSSKLGQSSTGLNLGAYKAYAEVYSGADRLYRHMGFGFKEKISLYKEEFTSSFAETHLEEQWSLASTGTSSFCTPLMKASLNNRLLNDYLVKIDRASMKNSLEVRSPFLDKELMEFAFGLPRNMLFQKGKDKYLLKKLAEKHVNPNILTQQKKGFSIPIRDWLRDELNAHVQHSLKQGNLKKLGIFNPAYLEKLASEISSGKPVEHKVWALLTLDIWLQKFVQV